MQFSIKQLLIAVTCLCASFAYTAWMHANPTARGDEVVAAIFVLCAGLGAAVGVLCGKAWVGIAVCLVVFFGIVAEF
jgi:hypothetical protein